MDVDNHLILIYAAFSYHSVADPLELCGRLSVRCKEAIQRPAFQGAAYTPSKWCHYDGRCKMHNALLTQLRLLGKCLL